MGAWIETIIVNLDRTIIMSHPMWVRGLKLVSKQWKGIELNVAPYVGAWIET